MRSSALSSPLAGAAGQLSAEAEADTAADDAKVAVEAAAQAQAKATLATTKLHAVSRGNYRRKVEHQIEGERRRSSRVTGSPITGVLIPEDSEQAIAAEQEEAASGALAEKQVIFSSSVRTKQHRVSSIPLSASLHCSSIQTLKSTTRTAMQQ
jgi:hypothetical protein